MFKEFREFIMRGNVLDLAVAVIIGAAFGKIVTSLVNDILMPPLGLVLKNVDFTNLFVDLSGGHHATLAAGQSGRRRNHRLRHISQQRHRFCDRRVRDLSDDPRRQQDEARSRAGRSHHQGMSVLPHHHSDRRHALPELHVELDLTIVIWPVADRDGYWLGGHAAP